MTEQRELDGNQVVELVTEYLDGSLDADAAGALPEQTRAGLLEAFRTLNSR